MHNHKTDITMVSVSTPTVNGSIELGYMDSACRTLARIVENADSYHLIAVRSTLPPGTTEEFVIPRVEAWSGLRAGVDFGVCFHPEFLREISALQDFLDAWIVVFGANDPRSGRIMRELYERIKGVNGRKNTPIIETDIRTAEMIKYANNLFNATKISFTNEIWSACQELGIDGNHVMEVVSKSAEGMWNPRYGTKGGYPYGGSCLPKDTVAFESYARQKGINMRVLQAVIECNETIKEMTDALIASAKKVAV
jgi:nucleotide sugar dehydrogenase